MKNLLNKEIRLAASPLTFLFILFGLMTMLPGYPILVGAFFVNFGIFHTFQSSRENNDVLYTVLLPVEKADAVRARFMLTSFVQLSSFMLMFVLTMVRMVCLKDAAVYVNNAMMNANQWYLTGMLVVSALFNCIFITGFYKTAYKIGGPFIAFGIAAFVVIAIFETLIHVPRLEILHRTDTMGSGMLWLVLLLGAVFYGVVTWLSCQKAIKAFDLVDL